MMKTFIFAALAICVSWKSTAQLRMVLRAPLYLDLQKGDSLSPKSTPGLAFYQGLKLALDSLANQGLELKLDISDEELEGDSIAPMKPWTEVEMILSKQGKVFFFTGKKYGAARIEFNAPMREHLAAMSSYLFQVPGKKKSAVVAPQQTSRKENLGSVER